MTKKVDFFDRMVREYYYKIITGVSTMVSLLLIFFEIPENYKTKVGLVFVLVLALIYVLVWCHANKMTNIKLNIEGSDVHIKIGNIFAQEGLKVIPFNEYFDTKVDDRIIAKVSLNGQYINKYHSNLNKLDSIISRDKDLREHIIDTNIPRDGKSTKYRLGSLVLVENFVLTAFAKFDEDNRANLSIYDYLLFLVHFWDEINKIYAQKSVTVPIFGSGITRFKGGFEDIDDNELLNIMIWTFKISKIKFEYPAKLSIIIHDKKIDQINIFKLKELEK